MTRETVAIYLAERTIYLEATLTHSGYQGDPKPPGQPADPWELESVHGFVCGGEEPALSDAVAEALAELWWDDLCDQLPVLHSALG